MPVTAREAALTALERCRRDNAWSGTVMDKLISKYALDKREASLAARLCLGVLQNSLLCDYYLGFYCDKKLEPKVRDILRIGIYQLLLLDKIPARAAVNESVSLCRAVGCERAAGLVNAVLRRIADDKEHLPPLPPYGSSEYLSVKYSFPIWLVERLTAERGYDFTEAFLAASNVSAKLYIQVNTLKVAVRDYIRALERTGIAYFAAEDLPGCIALEGGSVSELPGYEEGLFYVQDKAARQAVELAAPEGGMHVLDACSAPGGKAFAAAVRMGGKGSILCCDIHEKKLSLIVSGAQRMGIDILETRRMDAGLFDSALEGSFDVVIADVPCSGIGVISKKPEIRLKNEKDIAALPEIQLRILNNLSRYVKKGGTLLYSTCTVLKAENEAVVDSFLADNDDYDRQSVQMHSFFPNVDGTDGFFAARMKRVL